MTQLELAQKNKVSDVMRQVAKIENVELGYLRKKISEGKIVIPANINHRINKRYLLCVDRFQFLVTLFFIVPCVPGIYSNTF